MFVARLVGLGLFFFDFNRDIDEYGTYGVDGENAFYYIKKIGVSLLQNYPTTMFEEKMKMIQ